MGGTMKNGAVSTQNAATIGKKDVGGPSNPLKNSSSSSTASQSQVIQPRVPIALGLLLADSVPTVGLVKTFLRKTSRTLVSPSYPDETLDTFGFTVGVRSAGRLMARLT